MIINISRILLLPLTLMMLLSIAAARAEAPDRGDPPAWVQLAPFPSIPDSLPSDASGGFHYLLVDHQISIPDQQKYSRYIYRVTNSDGVQNLSDIDIEYDPSYQTLRFHEVKIHRDGRVIDNLADHEIEVYQRESMMEQNLYDGSETAVIKQKNVHIGDIIEYAVTTTGFNPIHEGDFFKKQYFKFAIPLGRYRIRLVADSGESLHFHYFNDAPEAHVRSDQGRTEYEWDLTDLPALTYEDNTPIWYDPYPSVWISSYDNWAKVVDWALPHYQVDPEDAAELSTRLSEISPGEKTEDRILESIRFVQDEIRYLGMEQGLGAYRPNQPFGVYERRFGDCKDKSLLLTALLRNLGVDAHPVLVNTVQNEKLDLEAHSPTAFNHCIVHFRHKGKDRFVDPTLTNQGGDLKNWSGLPYGMGLVLKDGVKGLKEIPPRPPHTVEITYHFTLEEVGGPAILEIHSEYSGASADQQRDQYLNFSVEDISRSNLDYYSQTYSGITQVTPPTLSDANRNGTNVVTVDEAYRVENFWTPTEKDSTQFFAELLPLEISQVVDLPAAAQRTSPYYLGYPLDMKLTIELDLPEDWPVGDDKSVIKGEAFRYESEVKGKGDQIRISYRYRRLAKSVPPEDISKVIAKHDRIQSDLLFYLTYDPNLDKYQFSWFAAALALAALLIGAYLAWRVHQEYDPTPGRGEWSPLPLGGVLILLMLGLIFQIIYLVANLGTTYLDHNTWLALMEDGGFTSFSILGTLLTFELICMTLLLVHSILALLQMLRKRSSFPRVMVIYLLFATVYTILDLLGAWFLLDDPIFHTNPEGDITRVVMHLAAIGFWTPYLLKARRPRHTFVIQRSPRPDPIEIVTLEPHDSHPEDVPPSPDREWGPSNIRIIRWPIPMVLAGILHLAAMATIAALLIFSAEENPYYNEVARGYFWLVYFLLFFVASFPFQVGLKSILGRRPWARWYHAILYLTCTLAIILGGFLEYQRDTEPDRFYGLVGTMVFSLPTLALALVFLISRAAKVFPNPHLAYRSSMPRTGISGDLPPNQKGDHPHSCRTRTADLFRLIADEISPFESILHDQDPYAPVALVVPLQPGVPRRIVLDLQKDNVFNLTIGPIWLTWKPCDWPVVREDFFNTVTGILGGHYRLEEFQRERQVVMARILRPERKKWVIVHRWPLNQSPSPRKLVKELVIFGLPPALTQDQAGISAQINTR